MFVVVVVAYGEQVLLYVDGFHYNYVPTITMFPSLLIIIPINIISAFSPNVLFLQLNLLLAYKKLNSLQNKLMSS